MAQATTANKLRALAHNPRVLAIVALAVVGAIYLRRNAGAAGSALDTTPNPVTPDALPGATRDPITLDPGQSVYDPNTGRLFPAPGDVLPPDDSAPPDDSTPPDAPSGGSARGSQGHLGKKVNIPSSVATVVARTKRHAGHPGGPALGKPGRLPPSALAVLTKIARPALAHPPSHSNVVKQTTTISRAIVHTHPSPRVRPRGRKELPKIPSSLTHASSAPLPKHTPARAAAKKKPPVRKSVARRVLAR